MNKRLRFSSMASPVGTVLNIQRFCYHDGPGIRTTVFLKGCSMNCKWCGNPESIHPDAEPAYDPKACLGAKECGLCMESPFPEGAFSVMQEDDDHIQVKWDQVRYIDEACISLCPTKALFMYGKSVTVEEVLAEVEKDVSFYRSSQGGITLSGGEPLLQPEFSAALLKEAQLRGLSTAIETAGNVPWTNMEQVMPYVDTVFHDFKIMNSEQHKKWIGVDNKLALENYNKAYAMFPDAEFIARTPLIPGVNANVETVRAVLEFIRPHKNVIEYELLPYHRLGLSKYELLGRAYDMRDYAAPSDALVRQLQAIIDSSFANAV